MNKKKKTNSNESMRVLEKAKPTNIRLQEYSSDCLCGNIKKVRQSRQRLVRIQSVLWEDPSCIKQNSCGLKNFAIQI